MTANTIHIFKWIIVTVVLFLGAFWFVAELTSDREVMQQAGFAREVIGRMRAEK